MNGLIKSALLRGILGFALGLPAGACILLLADPGALAGPAGRLAFILLSDGIYGAVAMGASVVYDIERWSVTRATLTHLVITLGGLYILGFVQGWLARSIPGLIAPMLGFIAVYCVIWFVQCLSLRNRVRQMNRDLKAWKSMRRMRSPSDSDGSNFTEF